MAKPETVIEPVSHEAVQLDLLVRVMHETVGVVVNRGDLTVAVEADHLGHTGIVVNPYCQLGIIQPATAVMDLLKEQGLCITGLLQYGNTDPPQVM